MSEVCISEITPPTVTKQASQFRPPLLRRKGAQLNITAHFPTPLQSEHSYDFVDQRTSSSSWGTSAAAQIREYNPFLCRTAAGLPPPELPDCRQSFGRQSDRWRSCPPAAEAVRPPSGSSGGVLRELNCRRSSAADCTPEVPETSDAVFMTHNIIRGAHSFWP